MDGNSENLGLKIDNLLSKFDQSQINLVNSIEAKINNLREEFQSTSSDVKRIKLDREFKWKREGNRDQTYAFLVLHYRHGRNAISVKLRMFQFKLLHRKLALDPFLLKIGIKSSDKMFFLWIGKGNSITLFFANVG